MAGLMVTPDLTGLFQPGWLPGPVILTRSYQWYLQNAPIMYFFLFPKSNQAGFWWGLATIFFQRNAIKRFLQHQPCHKFLPNASIPISSGLSPWRLLCTGCSSACTLYFHLFSLLPSRIDRRAHRFFKCLHSYWLKPQAELFQRLEQFREHIKFIQMSPFSIKDVLQKGKNDFIRIFFPNTVVGYRHSRHSSRFCCWGSVGEHPNKTQEYSPASSRLWLRA